MFSIDYEDLFPLSDDTFFEEVFKGSIEFYSRHKFIHFFDNGVF